MLAIVNARVLVSDGKGTEAEGLFASGDRIELVGSRAKVEAEARRRGGTKILDAGGGAVVPGFNDAHTHLVHWGLLRERVDLLETTSLSQALERIRKRVAADKRAGRGGWLIAERWDDSRWKENRYPTRQELDEVTGPRPVLMRRIDGHIACANTAGLDMIPSTAKFVDRESGIMKEDVVLNFNRLFPPPPGESLRALRWAQEDALRLGVTSVQDMVTPAYLRAWMDLRREGALKMRARLNPYHDMLPELAATGLGTGFGDEWLRLGAIKLFTDGSIGAHTAAVSFEYRDEPGNRGMLLWRDADLLRLAHEAQTAGFQLAMHAIGDRAVEQCLRVGANLAGKPLLARPMKKTPKAGRLLPLRHRIEHCELVSDGQLARTAAIGLGASMQPNFVGTWSARGGMYHQRFGDRFLDNNRYALMAEMGVRIAFGSDCMPLGPLWGVHAAVNAPEEAQRLRVEEAVTHYTLGSARLGFEEKEKGSLARGKLADFAILDSDLTKKTKVKDAKVLATVVGGDVKFSARRSWAAPTRRGGR